MIMIKINPRIQSLLLLSCVVLAACSSYKENRASMDNPWNQPKEWAAQVTFPPSEKQDVDPQSTQEEPGRFAQEGPGTSAPPLPSYELYQGDGRFMNLEPVKQREATESEEGDVTLNFQDTELSEVVKTILGDILQQN